MEKSTAPDEIPRLFIEAWNARRADWLITFFSTMYLASSPLRKGNIVFQDHSLLNYKNFYPHKSYCRYC
jgi:hypothetical protein